MTSRGESPPEGWVSHDGVLRAGVRVQDFVARAQRIVGTCRHDGCSRRLVLQPQELQRQGLGQLNIGDVKRLHMCQRIGGCSLSFHHDPPERPLRLAHCLGKPFVRIRVACRGTGCRFHRVWKVEEMIAGLVKRGQGDHATEIYGLGARMTSPCPLCKRANWRVDVIWANTDQMGWKARGEEYLVDLAQKRLED